VCLEAVRLEVGSALAPEPGFFPFLAGALLIALGVLLAGQALRPARTPDTRARRDRLAPPALVVAALVAYVGLLPWAGYPLITTLVLLATLRAQDTRWPPAVAASVLLSLGSYFLFVQLGVPLPAGRLFVD
jgi:hypothetical protein